MPMDIPAGPCGPVGWAGLPLWFSQGGRSGSVRRDVHIDRLSDHLALKKNTGVKQSSFQRAGHRPG